MDDELPRLRRLRYHASRIPALDALELFVPDGAPVDADLNEVQARTGSSRWYPVEGGHRVLVLFEGGAFNERRFTLRKGAWDHEHCKRCGDRIKSMDLCWVSTDGSYTILCAKCHELVSETLWHRLLKRVGLPLTFPRTSAGAGVRSQFDERQRTKNHAMYEVRMQACVIGPVGQRTLRVSLRGPADKHREVDVPTEGIPPQLRMPNSEFVAVMQYENFIRVEPEPAGRAWLELQQQIRSVLNAEWDPLRLADSVEDEYDLYIAGLYAMLQHDDSIEDIARHLLTLEGQMGGVGFNGIDLLREIADKLTRLELPRDIDTR